MKPYQANLLNAVILLALGLWGASGFFTGDGSATSLIAPACGLIFLLTTPMMRKENKAVAHIVVLLTLLLLVALVMPLMRQTGIAQIRVLVMMLSCAFALVIFIRSFIAARKAKNA